MDAPLPSAWPAGPAAAAASLEETFRRERGRLRSFIRRRVADACDADDIVQEVFSELVEAEHRLLPIEQVSAWLFRVARHRVIDLLRRRRTRGIEESIDTADDDSRGELEALLPAPDAGPEATYARRLLLEELDAALEELPPAQRGVFVAHELEGRSFKEIAAESGIGINTLLARKHQAVRHLRRRLQAIHDDFQSTQGETR